MNTEHKRNLQRAADFCREMKHDALAEACSRASAHIVELERAEAERDALAEQLNSVTSMAERFGQERDALRALIVEWADAWEGASDAMATGATCRLIRAESALVDAARKEGEG